MSTKQKKTIQKGSFKRLLKLFFFKNKMLTALMLFSIIISAVATALGPQYLGYATDSIVQDMSNPVSSNIHWDRFFFWAGISSVIFLIQFVSKWLSAWFSTRIISDTAKEYFEPVGEAGWGDAACIVPWSMYQLTGNIRILREQYDTMKKWCDYIINTAKKRRGKMKHPKEIDQYLWNTGHQYGEWLIPSQTVDGADQSAAKLINTSTYCAPIFGWNSCRIMADTAALLGHTSDELYYDDIASRMKSAIQKGLIDDDGKMPLDFMGSYVLAIAFDLAPERKKKSIAGHLIRKIEENGDCLDTGFLTTPYLLDALCKIGRMDKAYKILLQTKCPSWLYEVKQGATTIWENYISYKEDGSPVMTSLNHYAFGCVDDWMFRKISGIDMAAPGFKEIVIAPEPDNAFTSVKRTYISEYGEIAVRWSMDEGKFKLKVKIPCNTTAVVKMPDGRLYKVGSGMYQFE